ncbi:hypothetical protein MBLNU13_g05994t1 [Cladosporium sp. NU13]
MSAQEAQASLETYLNELESAISGGDLTALQAVIDRHSRSRLRDEVLTDALVISCDQGYPKAVQYLLAKESAKADSVSKNVRRRQNTPPLVLAVNYCEAFFHKEPTGELCDECQLKPAKSDQSSSGFKILDSLIRHGVSLTGRGPDNRNALSYVLRTEVAELLLAKRGESERRQALVEQRDGEGNDALMYAIMNTCCNEAVALKYIECGANKNTVDNEGRTTLMNAAWKQRTRVVQLLLEDKSIAGAKDKRGRNIWHHFAAYGHIEAGDDTAKLLFASKEAGANVNATDVQGQTPLHLSAYFGTSAVAEGLLEKRSIDPEICERHEKRTALHFAAANGHANLIRALLERGANRFAPYEGGLLPLHLVCGCLDDAVNAAKLLMAKDARRQLESRTEELMTPIHIAAAHGNVEIVNSILQAQIPIDIDARCEGGWTALHLACGRHMSDPRRRRASLMNRLSAEERTTDSAGKYLAVVRALLSADAQVNAKSRLSRTALYLAVEMGHVKIAELLLQQEGVQFAAKDSRGNTPLLDAAKSRERKQILQLLAPWNDMFVQSLPQDVKQAAQRYDANIIDFQEFVGPRMSRHKIPVFDVLYKGCGEAGAISHSCVSTRPNSAKDGAFRWIHLPANNLHWCHTLIMKHFIECSANAEVFRALEQSLNQQQSRGRRIHSRSMRPGLHRLARRFGDPNYQFAHDTAAGSHNTEFLEDTAVPSSPKEYTYTANQDFSGIRRRSGALSGSGHASNMYPERTSSPTTDISVAAQDIGACLFMPYLILENKENVVKMHDQLRTGLHGETRVDSADSDSHEKLSHGRDAKLHNAYSHWRSNDYSLEVRRTLDQFWHSNVDTRERDDNQVVQRYQEKRKKETPSWEQSKVDLLMVDQLWIWTLGPSLVVTSFPQDWQHPRAETPALLSSILEELDPRNGTAVRNVYELATCIIGHCLKASDEITDSRDSPIVTEIFEATIAELTQDESILSRRFNAASVSASLWIKHSLLKHNTQGNEGLQEFNDRYTKALQKIERGSDHIRSNLKDVNHDTEEPLFLEHLLDIQPEISFLEGVKRVQYELRILDRIAADQYRVTSSARDTLIAMQRNERPSQEPIYASWNEQLDYLQQHRNELAYLSGRVSDIYKSVIDLLDHKQRYANAIEARYARAPARTLMVFTVVTVVFLPLSFLASFFTINIRELPYVKDQEQQLTLSFVLRYVLGIGLGTALLCVAIALYHHDFVRWMNRRRVVVWVKKQRVKLTQAVFTTPKRRSKRLDDDGSDFELEDFASSSTLRSRRGHVRDDMEMGGSQVVR